MVEILAFAAVWLLISCAVAHVLGAACDIGQSPVDRLIDGAKVDWRVPAANDDSCVGVVLERVAQTPAGFIAVLYARPAADGGLSVPAPRILRTSPVRLPTA